MITILLATYNGETYIKELLDSLAAQTVTDWNLLVRDDGSTDHTLDILQEFSNKLPGKVRIISDGQPTGSAKRNFAALLQLALAPSNTGSDEISPDCHYYMCCDQDDVWYPDKLEQSLSQMKQLEEHFDSLSPLLVHGDVRVVDEQLRPLADSMFALSHIRPEATLAELLLQNNVTGCTMLFNHALLQGIAPFASSPDFIMHDYLAALYAAVFGHTAVIQAPLLAYRQHGDNSVGAKDNHHPLYLLQRIKDGKRQYREAMECSRRQIAFFLSCYQDALIKQANSKKSTNEAASISTSDVYRLLSDYATLGQKSHAARLWFYLHHRAWKCGAVRKIMQILWG